MRDLVFDLVGHAANVKYGDLPQDVVEITKKFILDTLGTAIAGSSAPGSSSTVDLIKDWGGTILKGTVHAEACTITE